MLEYLLWLYMVSNSFFEGLLLIAKGNSNSAINLAKKMIAGRYKYYWLMFFRAYKVS